MAHAHCTQGVLERVQRDGQVGRAVFLLKYPEPAPERGYAVSQRALCGHARKPTMYYYCSRTAMSASAAWPGAGGPQSCGARAGGGGGGGGGGGERVNGNGGGDSTEARSSSEWESATCDPADAARSASADSTVRARGASRCCCCCCCRRSAAQGGGGHDDDDDDDDDPRRWKIDGEPGGVRCARSVRESGARARSVSKRRGCGHPAASKRACVSGTSTGTGREAPVQNTAGSRPRRADTFPGGLSVARGVKAPGEAINGDRRGCRAARGRVRLCRVRSFLASAEALSAHGVPAAQLPGPGHRSPAPPHHQPPGRAGEAGSGTRRSAVNGTPCAGVSCSRQVEAKKRQVQLGDRTDMLWRRLHAVQVKQVERHVTQQLEDLRRAAAAPDSAELRRLAHSCSEALRTAGGALDSDHTASSSGGGSDSEEEEEEEGRGGGGGRHVSPSV